MKHQSGIGGRPEVLSHCFSITALMCYKLYIVLILAVCDMSSLYHFFISNFICIVEFIMKNKAENLYTI